MAIKPPSLKQRPPVLQNLADSIKERWDVVEGERAKERMYGTSLLLEIINKQGGQHVWKPGPTASTKGAGGQQEHQGQSKG